MGPLLPLLQNFQHFAISCTPPKFFGLPTWYEYLYKAGKVKPANLGTNHICDIVNFAFPGDLMLVFLAIIDILLRAAGLIAIGFVIFGGIQYVTSQGEPDKTKKAQGTIVNALIGLVITVISAAIVAFIGSRVGS